MLLQVSLTYEFIPILNCINIEPESLTVFDSILHIGDNNPIAAALAEANKIIAADEDQAMLANAAQIEAQMKSATSATGQSTSEFRARRLT
jgi:hypothetical protein